MLLDAKMKGVSYEVLVLMGPNAYQLLSYGQSKIIPESLIAGLEKTFTVRCHRQDVGMTQTGVSKRLCTLSET